LFEGKTVMRENPDPYAVLGVTPTATQTEITHAYRTQLRSLHPDTRHAPAQAAAVADARLRHILAAYAALRDPHHRADDDRTAQPATTTQPRRSDPPTTPHTSPNPQGPVQIPVTHHEHIQTPPEQRPPLWAGPVRHHH
jgi:curved DNA-binding protein CbpA